MVNWLKVRTKVSVESLCVRTFCKFWNSTGGICIIIWALFAFVLFSLNTLKALTKPVQTFPFSKEHVRAHPNNYTNSARGIPKFTFWLQPAHAMLIAGVRGPPAIMANALSMMAVQGAEMFELISSIDLSQVQPRLLTGPPERWE
jgi:hypothetical protein